MDVITDAAVAADAEVAADAARRVAAQALGHDVELAGPAEPLVGSHGRGAFACRLAGDAPGPWGPAGRGPRRDTAAAGRERGWHDFLAGRGHPVPAALGSVPVAGDRTALVLEQGPSLTLMEALGVTTRSPSRSCCGRWPRRTPRSTGWPSTAPRAATPRPRRWPSSTGRSPIPRRPPASGPTGPGWPTTLPPRPPPVVCHGDLQPASMRLEGDDTSTATLMNWSHARVGDAEDDVALTLLMFWSAPYLAEGIGQRKMLKTVRDMITDGYRSAYEGADGMAPLDEARLRYSGAAPTRGRDGRAAGRRRAAGRTRRRLGLRDARPPHGPVPQGSRSPVRTRMTRS